jgi:Fe-S oxidoreductase
MLARVDAHEGDVAKVTTADHRRIVDLCWQCKLCFNHCPYTPPPPVRHRLPAVDAAGQGGTHGGGRRELAGPLAGQHGHAGSPGLGHGASRELGQLLRAGRMLLEKTFGIERHRTLPKFHHKTFTRWFRERGGGRLAEGHKVAFFTTCVVNYNEPQVGRDAVSVLEKNGCALSCPESQVCCGMPYLDGGDLEAARANARRNIDALLPLVKAGADVVVTQPTCSYVLKKEYPLLVPGPDADAVAARRSTPSSSS